MLKSPSRNLILQKLSYFLNIRIVLQREMTAVVQSVIAFDPQMEG